MKQSCIAMLMLFSINVFAEGKLADTSTLVRRAYRVVDQIADNFSDLSVTPETKAFLGVLGPVRMNYSMAISRLNALKEYIENDRLDMIER